MLSVKRVVLFALPFMMMLGVVFFGVTSKASAQTSDTSLAMNTLSSNEVNLGQEDSTMSTCTRGTRTVSGSYKAGARQQVTVQYQVSYFVERNCSVIRVQDRTRTIGGNARWTSSCTGGNWGCRVRNTNISGSWTSWRGLPDTSVNGQYRHFTLLDRHSYSGTRTLPR